MFDPEGISGSAANHAELGVAESGCPAGARPSPGDAVQSLLADLGQLCEAELTERPAAELAGCLRGLERAESMLTAARAYVLQSFIARNGSAEDGHGSARTWLAWQTRVTRGAAAGAVGWARRLAAHPDIGARLAAGELSASWARQLCDWSDRLPADRRADADMILASAAAAGADLDGLGALAEEMYRRSAPPDTDSEDFGDRGLRLDRTFGGAGQLTGDLTPQCAAALAAVLESLGAKAGPEDTRTQIQRQHDALEEACRRLLGSGCLPDRAGQPAQIRLHMTLDELRGLPGGSKAVASWAADRCAPAGPGYDCDAQIAPEVDGQLDPAALDQLTRAWMRLHGLDNDSVSNDRHGGGGRHADRAEDTGQRPDESETGPRNTDSAAPSDTSSAGPAASATAGLPPATVGRLRSSLLRLAVDALSGPSGLAGYLRTALVPGPGASPSLPLDLGRPTETVPPHLRRAVIARDVHCGFPGCYQPPEACQVHHLIPRSEGGPTSLDHLILGCSFHHLIAIHRWGWKLSLGPDGVITAVSPDGNRILRGHSPPPATAA